MSVFIKRDGVDGLGYRFELFKRKLHLPTVANAFQLVLHTIDLNRIVEPMDSDGFTFRTFKKGQTLTVSGTELTEQAPAHVPQPGPGNPEDAYIERLQGLPCPSSSGKIWPNHQQTSSPLFNCLRPAYARGPSATLMHRIFGLFVDLMSSVKLDAGTIEVGKRLISDMSRSYINSNTHARGAENERARILREHLLKLMRLLLGDAAASTLEPSAPSLASNSTNDGSVRLEARAGELLTHSLIMEVKEGVGLGGGSDPMMQMTHYYGLRLPRLKKSHVTRETCYPAFGLEVVGNMFRVHALYYADKVCCEPLSPMMHFSDMRYIVPGYTETMMRTLKALVLALGELRKYYQLFGPDNRRSEEPRDPHLAAGIPYVIRERHAEGATITCLPKTSCKVYIIDRGESGKVVGKIASDHQEYPVELHKEAAAKGLAPELVHTEALPGGFSYVEMEYLDERDGWCKLSEYQGDLDAVRAPCKASLHELHACLGGQAVHGDVRPANIMIRDTNRRHDAASGSCTPGAGDEAASSVQIKIIDWDWGGLHKQVRYPSFISTRVDWAIKDPADERITQKHDKIMMKKSLANIAALRGNTPAPKGLQLKSPPRPEVQCTEPNTRKHGKKRANVSNPAVREEQPTKKAKTAKREEQPTNKAKTAKRS